MPLAGLEADLAPGRNQKWQPEGLTSGRHAGGAAALNASSPQGGTAINSSHSGPALWRSVGGGATLALKSERLNVRICTGGCGWAQNVYGEHVRDSVLHVGGECIPYLLIDGLQDGPKSAPKAPESASRGPKEAPRRPQAAPKRPPRGSQETPKRPQEDPRGTQDAQRRPRARQEAPKTPQEASK